MSRLFNISLGSNYFQACPDLRVIARVRNWGRVTPEEVEGIKRELKLRNVDLQIDEGTEQHRRF